MNSGEKNKLIAKFMGLKTMKEIGGINEENEHLSDHFFIATQYVPYFHPDTLKYDSSWDWLIPVITKISSTIEAEGCGEPAVLDASYGDIVHDIRNLTQYNDIKGAYDKVVEVVRLLNLNS